MPAFLPIIIMLGMSLIPGLIAVKLKLISKSGSSGLVILSTIFYFCGGFWFFVIFWIYFAIIVLAARYKHLQKIEMGIDEDMQSRIWSDKVIFGLLPSAIFLVLHNVLMIGKMGILLPSLGIASISSLVTACWDIVSYQINGFFIKVAYNPTRFEKAVPGTPGSISLIGIIIGALLAILLTFIGLKLFLVGFTFVPKLSGRPQESTYPVLVGAALFLGALIANLVKNRAIFKDAKLIKNNLFRVTIGFLGGLISGFIVFLILLQHWGAKLIYTNEYPIY